MQGEVWACGDDEGCGRTALGRRCASAVGAGAYRALLTEVVENVNTVAVVEGRAGGPVRGRAAVSVQRLISSPQLMLAYSYARKLTERSRSYRTSHRGWVPEHARQDVNEASTEAHADPTCGGHRRNWLKRGLGERNSHPLATYSESRRTVRPSTARAKVRAVRPHIASKGSSV